ncbi:hypothetical protein [Sandaracinus amylolyticus]|uniref:hypothetical protein n=1 Tax=Sandaracinus amylolyticus TaxID=927083 RepID=UPI001F36B04E|nr:hypothetical protein [Sandaracinus amylolyticus]UJR78759.1 ZU5 domain-containing protein [Sandaracinus amylolyticus]
MRIATRGSMMLVAAVLAACAESRVHEGAPVGTPCDDPSECATEICAGRCTTSCELDAECTPGWSCASTAEVCTCVPRAERCNGLDDDCDGRIDGAGDELCGTGLTCEDATCVCDGSGASDTDELDLLFVIDDSGSMGEEQASLTEELPRFVQALSTGDRDGDGTRDFDPVTSLHVAVVTTDMGVGGNLVPTCDGGLFGAELGDDGVMITAGRTSILGCMPSYPAIFQYRAGEDVADFAMELACVATVGTGGCGFEQPLEAALKAISPSTAREGYTPPIFLGGTRGHGDGVNAGFLREGSVLGVLVVTDEEDCSTPDPGIFDPSDERFSSADLSLRCFAFPDVPHRIERYVAGEDGRAGLLGLRRDPSRLVFGVLAGIPVDAATDPAHPDFDAILEHPDMQEIVDPSMPTRLRPSCNVPGAGVSFAPRRIVEVARGLDARGAGAVVGSICQNSFAGQFDGMIEALGAALTRPECP